MTFTKQQLLEHLSKLEKSAQNNIARKGKYSSLAQTFLDDYSSFSNILNTISESQHFNVVRTNNKVYYNRKNLQNWFDSFSIKLFQDDTTFYIYIIAEYVIK